MGPRKLAFISIHNTYRKILYTGTVNCWKGQGVSAQKENLDLNKFVKQIPKEFSLVIGSQE